MSCGPSKLKCGWLLIALWALSPGEEVAAGYIPDMPYFHQGSNRLNPGGSCQNTCVAIVLKYYGADDITPDKISAKWGTYVAQTTGGLERVFNEEAQLRGLSVRDRATGNGTLRELHALLDAGRPVIVHGRFSEVGHLLVLIGYDERYYVVMDPAGQWAERNNGGFTNTSNTTIGRYTRYSRAAVEDAILSTDHRGLVRMHQIYFDTGDLAAEWEGSISDSVAVGGAVELAGGVRVGGAGDGVRVFADLSAVGGAQAVELAEAEAGFYPLAETLAAQGAAGRKTIVLRVERGDAEVVIERDVVFLPPQSQAVFVDDFASGWRRGFTANAELSVTETEPGRRALAVDASGFTVELLPATPVPPSGYRALRFAFRRGEATAGLRPAFSVQLNEDPRKLEALIGGFLRGIDLAHDGWQTVEVPLWAFAPLEEPIESIRLFGNLRGTFYLRDIELVSALFPPPHLQADWHSALPDSLLAGAELVLDEEIRVTSTEVDGPAPQVVADLSALGGPAALALAPSGAGQYRLAWQASADVPNGVKQVRVHIRQQAPDGPLETSLSREVLVLPAADQIVFDERYGANWGQGFSVNVAVDDGATEQVYAGAIAQALAAEAFTLEYQPVAPVDPAGYRALRLAFHPGDAGGGARPAFNVMVNGDTPSLVPLLAGDVEGVQLDLGVREWQVVEIPLALFYRLDGPIESIRLFGNLRGTFYLDDVRLVAARPPQAAPTAVRESRRAAAPEDFALAQNYPNPFNSATVIRFALPEAGAVRLAVYNMLGQQVAVLAQGARQAGVYQLAWDGRDDGGRPLASGLYLYRLQTAQGAQTRKLILLR